MKDINEMIADAKAEEQAEQEQKRDTFRDTFREDLTSKLKSLFGESEKKTETVKLDVEEYAMLKAQELDFKRVLGAIVDDMYLGYDNKSLRLDGENTINAIKILFNDLYEAILADKQEEAKLKEVE